MNQPYYSSQREKLLKNFTRACGWYRPYLTASYGQDWTEQTLALSKKNYDRLIPRIPFIGGPKVHMHEDLMESVQVLAILQALKSSGRSMDEMKLILHEGVRTRIRQYPKIVRKLAGWRAFFPPFIRNLQRQSSQSRERKYPAGFVFDVVIGDGKNFDWGLNFTECGICKFYAQEGAAEFLPIVCTIDYAMSDELDYGLVRTQTLAEGAAYCNPRMKHGRLTQWPVK